jgi:hypothetical protein
MLAEINIAISKKSMTLVMRLGEAVKDQEVWTYDLISKTEAKEVARTIFDDAYDFLNICVHGDPEVVAEEEAETEEGDDDQPG